MDRCEGMSTSRILTKEAFASIPAMLAGGLATAEIANRLGVTPATLKVRCSQEGISLRRPHLPPRETLHVKVSPQLAAFYAKRADELGMTAASMMRRLLEVIARDDLIVAVLDPPRRCATRDPLSALPAARIGRCAPDCCPASAAAG